MRTDLPQLGSRPSARTGASGSRRSRNDRAPRHPAPPGADRRPRPRAGDRRVRPGGRQSRAGGEGLRRPTGVSLHRRAARRRRGGRGQHRLADRAPLRAGPAGAPRRQARPLQQDDVGPRRRGDRADRACRRARPAGRRLARRDAAAPQPGDSPPHRRRRARDGLLGDLRRRLRPLPRGRTRARRDGRRAGDRPELVLPPSGRRAALRHDGLRAARPDGNPRTGAARHRALGRARPRA